MDNNKGTILQEEKPKKRLTVPMRLLMCVCTVLLLCLYATDLAGGFGLPILLAAAAFDTVLLIDAGRSKLFMAAILIANLTPFVIAGVVTSSVTAALNVLFPIITALPIWLTIRMGLGRSASIAASAICQTLLFFIIFALAVYTQYGSLTVETVKNVIELMLAPFGELFEKYSTQVVDGKTVQLFTTQDISEMLYIIKTTLIGSLAAMMLIGSYLVTLAARLIMKATGTEYMLPSSSRVGIRAHFGKDGPKVEFMHETVVWRIELDSVSAGVFIIAYIFTILFASSNSTLMLYAVAANIMSILSPAFTYCGIREIALGFKGRATLGRISRWTLILCLIFFVISPSSIAILLGVLGVIVTLRENRARRHANTIGKE